MESRTRYVNGSWYSEEEWGRRTVSEAKINTAWATFWRELSATILDDVDEDDEIVAVSLPVSEWRNIL